jgi:hypothetical protein
LFASWVAEASLFDEKSFAAVVNAFFRKMDRQRVPRSLYFLTRRCPRVPRTLSFAKWTANECRERLLFRKNHDRGAVFNYLARRRPERGYGSRMSYQVTTPATSIARETSSRRCPRPVAGRERERQRWQNGRLYWGRGTAEAGQRALRGEQGTQGRGRS